MKSALKTHTGNVRRVYDQLLKAETPNPAEAILPEEFDGAEAEWKDLLAAHSFRDPETAVRVLKEFAEGPGYVHVSPHTTELVRQLILKFLALCPKHGVESTANTVVIGPPVSNQISFRSRPGADAAGKFH